MTDTPTFSAPRDLVEQLEPIYWSAYRRAQNRRNDFDDLHKDQHTALRYAIMAVVRDLVNRGWRPVTRPDLAADANAEPIVIGPDCIALGDVISYRGDHYRKTRGGELVLDPPEARLFLAFLDAIKSRPAAEAPDESAADDDAAVDAPASPPDPRRGGVFVLDGSPAPTVGVNVGGFAESLTLAGLAAIQRCRCWNRELGPCEIPEHRDLAERHRKKNGPWPTAAEVPDDVRFTPQSKTLRHSIFKRGTRPDEYAALNDYTTTRGYRIWDEDAVDELAPFVRADGGHA